MSALLTRQFQVGGAVRQGAFYVSRPADEELPAALLNGEFCYVLAPRQIGKSSLRVRTRQRLEQAGVRCITIDLTTIGSRDSTTEQWYFGIVDELSQQLDLSSPDKLWKQQSLKSPVHRFSQYLRNEVLESTSEQKIVIFIDELDAVLSQQTISRDDFFAAVRACYNARADDPAYSRLTFCLIGVALPGDLIADETRTPFNIGHGISLNDFTRAELDVFLPGLMDLSVEPNSVLDAVYSWTNGHPYMTQKICQALSSEMKDFTQVLPRSINQTVEQLFLRKGRVLEANLSYAEKFFLAENRAARIVPMLRLYGRLLKDEPVAAQGDNPVQVALRLTGMAAEHQDESGVWLTVRNRIFATVFDLAWVRKQESDRLIAEPLHRWLESNKSEDHLLRGQTLAEARSWSRSQSTVTAEEGAFLLASLDLAHRETEALRQLEEARQLADKERAHRQLQDDVARGQQVKILTTAFAWRSLAFYVVVSQLIPYLVDSLKFPKEEAQSLSDTYFTMMFLAPIFGGMLSDRILGYRRCMLLGTALLTIGYFMMSVPNRTVLYVALGLQVVGHGLDRASTATLVGSIYPNNDAKKFGAFFIYYLVINAGLVMHAILSYFINQRYGANIGLAASGPSAMISLIFCLLSDKSICDSVSLQNSSEAKSTRSWSIRVTGHGPVRILFILCIIVSLFWIGVEQNQVSLTYWANHNVDRTLGSWLRMPINASTMLLLNPIFVSMIIPVLLVFFGIMRRRSLELSNLSIMILGFILNALAFTFLTYAGYGNASGGRVNAGWFIVFLFVSAISEVCVVPVGMVIVSNLSPRRNSSTLMGAWLVAVTVGSMLASRIGYIWQSKIQHHFFSLLAGISLIGGLLLAIRVGNFKRATIFTK